MKNTHFFLLENKGSGVAQVVEHLPSKSKALSSIPTTTKKEREREREEEKRRKEKNSKVSTENKVQFLSGEIAESLLDIGGSHL
jgi:hypothetical protein